MVQVDGGPSVVYALRSRLIGVFSLYTSTHYINGRCRVVVAVNSPMRVDARSCMNVSEQVIASIIYDSRCGMNYVAFRTAPPIGGLSCLGMIFLSYVFLVSTYVRSYAG